MQVRLTTDRAGLGVMQFAGEVIELPPREALALIRNGSAEPVEPEAAMTTPAEKATLHRARPRRK